MAQTRIAIIGAGIAGAAAIAALAQDRGGNKPAIQLSLFEKSRGYGGRMATRRLTDAAGEGVHNHGAQFVTARSDALQEQLMRLTSTGCVAPWEPRVLTFDGEQSPYKREWFEPHFIATRGMSSIAAAIIDDAADGSSYADGSNPTASLETFLQTRVVDLQRHPEGWQLRDEQNRTHGPFDWVVSTLPPAQAEALLPDEVEWKAALQQVRFSPCYALLLCGDKPLPLPCDAAVVRNSPIAWISAEASRPGHTAEPLYTVHSDNHWAAEHLDDEAAEVTSLLLQALKALVPGLNLDNFGQDLHRWRYARCEQALQEGDFLISEENRIACCGDWCRGNRVEDAFLSGHRLGLKLAQILD